MIIFILTDNWSSPTILKHKKDLENLKMKVDIISSWQLMTEVSNMPYDHALVLDEESCFLCVGDLYKCVSEVTVCDLLVPFVCPNKNFTS